MKPKDSLTHLLIGFSFGTILSASIGCRDKCDDISCLNILDHASTYSQLNYKIKESFNIEQLKYELNKQVDRISLSLHSKFIYCCLPGVLVYLLLILVCVFHFFG